MKIALVAGHVTQPARADDTHGTNSHYANSHYANPHCSDPLCADQAAHVAGLGRALAAQGHRVVVYARKDSPRLPDTAALGSRLTAQYITAGPPAQAAAGCLPSHLGAFGAGLAARWRRSAPQIVHAFGWTNGLAALLAAREHEVPIVQAFGSLAVAERRRGIAAGQDAARLRMERCLAKSVTGVIASTSEEAGDLARLGVQSARAAMVPCGVDLARFEPEGRAAERSDLRRLVYVGPLADHQRLDVLIRALAEVPSAELIIAGGPAAADLDASVAFKRLGKLAAGLGVADRVAFTGQLGGKELPALLRSADLFVSAASHEPLGLTAISAMACGVPVIAAAVGAYADAVIDGTTGLLLPSPQPQLLASRLRDLLAFPLRVTAFGIAAADRARSRYSWDRIAGETAAAYERFLAGDAAPVTGRAFGAPTEPGDLAVAGRRAA